MTKLHDDRKLPMIFIHSVLDDYGLDPYQYRIYARIARRAGKGECFESIQSMAEGCRMGTGTVKRALKFLVEHRFVTRHSQLGQPSTYRLTDEHFWIPSPETTQVKKTATPRSETTQPRNDPGRQRSRGGSETTQGVDHCDPGGGSETTHKVDPTKGVPISESNKSSKSNAFSSSSQLSNAEQTTRESASASRENVANHPGLFPYRQPMAIPVTPTFQGPWGVGNTPELNAFEAWLIEKATREGKQKPDAWAFKVIDNIAKGGPQRIWSEFKGEPSTSADHPQGWANEISGMDSLQRRMWVRQGDTPEEQKARSKFVREYATTNQAS